jgi:hypothetical protein
VRSSVTYHGTTLTKQNSTCESWSVPWRTLGNGLVRLEEIDEIDPVGIEI